MPAMIEMGKPHLPSHGKRPIVNLPYDPTGLRTTKTATWAAVEKELEKVKPDHLVVPAWINEVEEMQAEREIKGLPEAIGRPQKLIFSQNYHQVKW